MDFTTPAAAPAQPAESTISAARDAANKGDFSAFLDADTAARDGAPKPRIETPAPAAKAAAPATETADPPASPTPQAPPVSKRQDDINNKIREAVDRATADLRAQLAARPAPAQPVAPAAPETPSTPEWKRIAALPDAPKLEQFDGPNALGEHAAAMALFVHETKQSADQQRSQQAQHETAQRARVDGFHATLTAAKTADPDFINKITPEVRALKPLGALAPGESAGPLNILTEQIYDSPIADRVLLHLSQHPDALQRFAAVPPQIAALHPSQRVQAHVQYLIREFGKLEGQIEASTAPPVQPAATVQPSTITAAPPPPPTLTRAGGTADPKAAAFARGDFAAWDRIEMSEQMAKRGKPA